MTRLLILSHFYQVGLVGNLILGNADILRKSRKWVCHHGKIDQMSVPEYDSSRLPQHEFDSEFCATEKYQKLSCVHRHTPARCVCTQGFDIGRRFLGCPLEACAFVNWLDDEWHGRAQSVITKLAEDNINLKKNLTEPECTVSMMKQEIINQKQHMKVRGKKELACVVVVVALAIFYALFTMMIRGFV
ncbi:hypothetical protein ZWY2020_053027 [Hordeum vulgare]|nr:hypothetical protein ZWY2020_053027 [Hordeum vulgare]